MMLKVISLVLFAFLLTLFVGPIYAETTIIKNEDHDLINYGNGTGSLVSHPPRINNGTAWVDYILTENATTYKIETGQGSMIFHKTGCNSMFYPSGLILANSTANVSSESSIIHQKDLTTNSTWSYITDVNNAVCTNTITESEGFLQLESNKTSTNLATFSTKYIKNDGIPIKVLLQVVNENPSWTNNTMGFIETIHVPDTITMNGTDYYIPSNNGTFFDHSFFNMTYSLPIKFGDEVQYRTDNGLINLWGATLLYENGTSKITFDYSLNDIATPVGQAYEIDPTFVSGGTQRSSVDFDGDNVCEDTTSSSYIDAGLALIWSSGELSFGGAVDCFRGSLRVDISSIPNTILSVDNVVYKIAKTPAITFLRTSQTHNYYGMVSDPNGLSVTAHFDAIDDGTFLATQLINTNDNDVDLGATADSELFTIITTDSREWYAIGQRQVSVPAGFESGYTAGTGTLTIVYTEGAGPPNRPINVNATAIQRDAFIQWTQPIGNTTTANATDFTIKRNGTTIVESLKGEGFTGVLFEDFNSYVSNATADLIWTHSDCNDVTSLNGFCGVNATAGKVIVNATSAARTGITYDVLTNNGFTLTNSTGDGDFTLLFDIDYDSDGDNSDVGNFFIGVGNETGLELPSKDTDYLGIRITESGFGVAHSYGVYMSDNQDRSLDGLDLGIGITGDAEKRLFFNMTFISDTSTLFTSVFEDANRTISLSTLPRINVQALETYNNLRFILLTPFAFGDNTNYNLWNIDNIQLFVNGTGTPITNYLDTTVNLDTTYNYTIKAVTTDLGNSTFSDGAIVTTNDFPDVVTNGLVNRDVDTIIDLQWIIPLDYGEGSPSTGILPKEVVIFKENTTDTPGFSFLTTLPSITNFFNDTQVDTGKVYTYALFSQNSIGLSEANVTLTSFPIPPAPTNLTATTNLIGQINLNWDAVGATFVTNYDVFNSSTGAAPFDLLVTIGNTTSFKDLNLPDNFDMFYKVSSWFNPNSTNSTVVMGTASSPGKPVDISNVNATANLANAIVEWVSTGVNTTDFTVERNGTLIAASTTVNNTFSTVSADEDIFIQDLLNFNGSKWQYREQRIDPAPGVVATCGFTNSGTALRIASTIGESECFVFKTFPRVLLNNSKVQINFEYTHTSTPSGLQNFIIFNTQNSPNALNRDDKGPPVWTLDTTPPFSATEVDDLFPPITITNGLGFFNTGRFTEEKDLLTTNSEADTDYASIRIEYEDGNGLSQSARLFIYWINITDATTGADRAFYNFSSSTITSEPETCANVPGDGGGPRCIRGTISPSVFNIEIGSVINQTLGSSFNDTTVALGTHYLYDVTGVNQINGSTTIGDPTTSNLVKTNDIPRQVLNVIADLANFFTLNQIELSWTQAIDGSGNPLGVGVNLTETRIYSKNITDGDDFILTTTLLATSPPPTEFNDTNIIVPNDYSYLLSSCNILGCGPNSTETFADTIDFPDAIFDLLFYDLTFQSLILNWTQPFLGGGSLQDGYQINFTTPHAEPLTIIADDTESSFTEFTVSGLTELTNYTFRVSAINQAGLNATGLKLNITTLDDFVEENFTVGFIGEFPDSMINETNIDIIPIRFERIDINDTTVMLNVTYANNIDLACQFDYKFAMTESFFDAPLDTVSVGGGDQETSFLFLDFDNEVVDVFCWNEVNNQSGSYILVQQNFPLLEQIAAFRAGDFGTEGMFGILDMVTLMVIIVSMIGFNRVNETVGALFNIVFIGALAFFGIIELSTTIFAAIALVLMLVIITTRKV